MWNRNVWCPLRSYGMTYCGQTMFFPKDNILYIRFMHKNTGNLFKSRKQPGYIGLLYNKISNSSVIHTVPVIKKEIDQLIIQGHIF